MTDIPANFPSAAQLSALGAFTLGTLDGYLKDGGTAEDVLVNMFKGIALTGISLPLDGD